MCIRDSLSPVSINLRPQAPAGSERSPPEFAVGRTPSGVDSAKHLFLANIRVLYIALSIHRRWPLNSTRNPSGNALSSSARERFSARVVARGLPNPRKFAGSADLAFPFARTCFLLSHPPFHLSSILAKSSLPGQEKIFWDPTRSSANAFLRSTSAFVSSSYRRAARSRNFPSGSSIQHRTPTRHALGTC